MRPRVSVLVGFGAENSPGLERRPIAFLLCCELPGERGEVDSMSAALRLFMIVEEGENQVSKWWRIGVGW